MNELAHLASLLDLTEDEVNDLTNAILAVEGRPLSAVQADIRTVMNLTGTQMRILAVGRPLPARAGRASRLHP